MTAKDDEIKKVVAELENLLDKLGVNVTALSAILTRPAAPGQDERTVSP